jgi:hypothetical protein
MCNHRGELGDRQSMGAYTWTMQASQATTDDLGGTEAAGRAGVSELSHGTAPGLNLGDCSIAL